MLTAAMQLFVIRHAAGHAGSAGGAGTNSAAEDAERALDDADAHKLDALVTSLQRLELGFDRIVTSPWRRAIDTATRLHPLCSRPPVTTELLARAPSRELLEMLGEVDDTTAVVGHEPWLGELAAWLAFGDPQRADTLQLKNGGAVWLEGEVVPGGMSLRAILQSTLARKRTGP
jgi:phosphohistidine phosphatase